MRRTWIVTVVLALAASVASADPAADTDAATARLAKDTKDRAALVAKKAAAARSYEDQLAAVDRLKQQRKSWRRERQLQDAQAKALDTSKQLETLTGKIAALDGAIATDKRSVVVAIDAELPKLADGTRKQQLVAARTAAAPPASKAHKIVVPDAEIDPLADPEELDQQAAAIKASEAELTKQVDLLDDQARKLQKAADLRKAHDRAGDLAVRDDDQPRRTGAGGSGRTAGVGGEGLHDTGDDNPAPTENPTDTSPPPSGTDLGGFMGEQTAQVLGDVIDPATGEALRRAGRASDPGTKAEAAKAARDQVKARLEALRKKRAAVEARAKALRSK